MTALIPRLVTVGWIASISWTGSFAQGQSATAATSDDVTVEEVKTFLDPTVMIHGIDYSFTTNSLPLPARLYTHRFKGFWAINAWTGVWAELPVRNLASPERSDDSGVGDTVLGWGAITHEKLDSRLTTSVVTFEALAPTGDPDRGTGVGTWILAPGAAAAFNPTDRFPVYVLGRYLHSVESLGGRSRGDEVEGRPSLKVRSVELTVQTVHILPKGFFLSAVPSFVFNLNQDFNFFSIGVGMGRALSRHFLLSGAYVHHVAGRKTFNRAFSVQLSFLFGERRDRP